MDSSTKSRIQGKLSIIADCRLPIMNSEVLKSCNSLKPHSSQLSARNLDDKLKCIEHCVEYLISNRGTL
jgi:hypothetical protein